MRLQHIQTQGTTGGGEINKIFGLQQQSIEPGLQQQSNEPGLQQQSIEPGIGAFREKRKEISSGHMLLPQPKNRQDSSCLINWIRTRACPLPRVPVWQDSEKSLRLKYTRLYINEQSNSNQKTGVKLTNFAFIRLGKSMTSVAVKHYYPFAKKDIKVSATISINTPILIHRGGTELQ